MKAKKIRDIIFCIITLCAAVCFFAAYFIQERDAMYFILGCAWVCISAIKIDSIVRKSKQQS